MRLTDLEPRLIRYETRIETYTVIVGDHETWRERGCPTEPRTGPVQYTVRAERLEDAQGIMFLCPVCFTANGGPVGTHLCEVTFANRGVLDTQGCHGREGKPTRWSVSGTSLEDLSTQPSILLEGGCNWHGYITNGEVST